MKKSFLYYMVFLLTSCITINIYFPAAAVEKAADRIVEEVWGEKSRQKQEEQHKLEELKKEGQPQSMLNNSWKLVFSILEPEQAYAQEADINVTTPAIRALKESIQSRSDLIKPYMDSGNAGISNDGLIEIRNTEGLNLKDKATLARLIEKENKDRETMYIEIAKANNFPDKVSEIRKIFAKSWIRNAKKGWWFQDSEGKWKQK